MVKICRLQKIQSTSKKNEGKYCKNKKQMKDQYIIGRNNSKIATKRNLAKKNKQE